MATLVCLTLCQHYETSVQDMANGASVLLRTVLEIDGGALE